MEPRQQISMTIVLLTFFVLSLSLAMSWQAWADFRANRWMVQANEIADHLMRANVSLALERGLSSAALGAKHPISSAKQHELLLLRHDVGISWSFAQETTRLLIAAQPGDSALTDAVEKAEKAHANLEIERRLIETCLTKIGMCPTDGSHWFEVISAFIEALSHVQSTIFLTIDSRREVMQLNLTLKRWAMVASESAGRERGSLAWYIAARMPVPDSVLQSLGEQRGVVLRTTGEMTTFSQRHDADPRIVEAVKVMQKKFLVDFEMLRSQVYAAARSGDYPFDADEWVNAATRAIDTLVAVSTTSSLITEERARRAMDMETGRMIIHILLTLSAIALALIGLTKVRQTANELVRQKEMAEITLHSIGDAVIATDAAAQIEYLNPAAEELVGWSVLEARGRRLDEVFHVINGFSRDPEASPIESCLRERRVVSLASNTILVRRDGTELMIEDSAAPILNHEGEIVGAVMVFYDVGRMRGVPHLLSYHATHDAMTGLVNRREFERRLSELLARTRHTQERHALAYLDLDQFKLVNDTCGHAVGDRLLCQLTYLLTEKVRETDTLARLGGDEFGLLLENCSLDRALVISNEMRETVKNFRFVWQDHSFDIGVSIGLVPISADTVSAAEVLSEADSACFAAKEKGRNRVQTHAPGDVEMAKRHGEMQWVSRLKKALDENRFQLFLQTIVPFLDNQPPHGEVLLRLRDEDGHMVPPLAFLPAAERYDLMPAIDRWVIHYALEQIGNHLARQGASVVCNINLSGASLGDEGIQAYIEERLAMFKVPPEMICFEVTESVAIANLERAATLIRALQKNGCQFALDDFGSGLSSFAYLRALPINYLKIDGVFVKDVAKDPVAHAMVQAIHTVGNVMGIRTVAEYVEDEQVLAVIRSIGVDYAQGYAIALPCPMSDWLSRLQ